MLIFSSAFNGFDRVWYQNLACHLSILFMSKLTCSSALIANNTIRKFIDWYYRAADHSARQLFRTQKKIHISTTFQQKHKKDSSKSVIFQFVRDKRATDHIQLKPIKLVHHEGNLHVLLRCIKECWAWWLRKSVVLSRQDNFSNDCRYMKITYVHCGEETNIRDPRSYEHCWTSSWNKACPYGIWTHDLCEILLWLLMQTNLTLMCVAL